MPHNPARLPSPPRNVPGYTSGSLPLLFLTAPGSSDRLSQQLERPLSPPGNRRCKATYPPLTLRPASHSGNRVLLRSSGFPPAHPPLRWRMRRGSSHVRLFPVVSISMREHSRLGKTPLHDVLDLLSPRLKFADMSGAAFRDRHSASPPHVRSNDIPFSRPDETKATVAVRAFHEHSCTFWQEMNPHILSGSKTT